MAASAVFTQQFIPTSDPDVVTVYSDTAYKPGDIIQLANGKAAYFEGLTPNVNANGKAACSFRTKGCGKVPKASGTVFADGAQVNWDSSGKLAVAKSAGNFTLGTARGAGANGATSVLVDLNTPSLPSS